MLCKGTLLRMRLAVDVRSVLRCSRNVTHNDLRIETCWSDLKCSNLKFHVSALDGVIIKVILQNARCNNKDKYYIILMVLYLRQIVFSSRYARKL